MVDFSGARSSRAGGKMAVPVRDIEFYTPYIIIQCKAKIAGKDWEIEDRA